MSTVAYYRCTGDATVGVSPDADPDNWELFTPAAKVVDFGDPGLPESPTPTTGGGGVTTLDDLMLPALTGTGSLASQIVTTADIPTWRNAYDATYGVGTYILTNGTEVTAVPNHIRASDYAENSEHQCVWKRVS